MTNDNSTQCWNLSYKRFRCSFTIMFWCVIMIWSQARYLRRSIKKEKLCTRIPLTYCVNLTKYGSMKLETVFQSGPGYLHNHNGSHKCLDYFVHLFHLMISRRVTVTSLCILFWCTYNELLCDDWKIYPTF